MVESNSRPNLPPAGAFTLHDVAELRGAVGWLMWAIFLPPLLANLTGFGIGFVGAQSFLFVSIGIGTIGVVLRLVAVFGLILAGRVFCRSESLSKALALVAGAHAVVYILIRLARLVEHNAPISSIFIVRHASFVIAPLETLAMVVGLLFLRSLAHCLRGDALGRKITCFIPAVFLANAGSLVFPRAWPRYYSSPWFMYLFFTLFFVQAGVWMWALLLLYRFRKMLKLVLDNRCANCGYSLQGLPEPRCPECGRATAIALPASP